MDTLKGVIIMAMAIAIVIGLMIYIKAQSNPPALESPIWLSGGGMNGM